MFQPKFLWLKTCLWCLKPWLCVDSLPLRQTTPTWRFCVNPACTLLLADQKKPSQVISHFSHAAAESGMHMDKTGCVSAHAAEWSGWFAGLRSKTEQLLSLHVSLVLLTLDHFATYLWVKRRHIYAVIISCFVPHWRCWTGWPPLNNAGSIQGASLVNYRQRYPGVGGSIEHLSPLVCGVVVWSRSSMATAEEDLGVQAAPSALSNEQWIAPYIGGSPGISASALWVIMLPDIGGGNYLKRHLFLNTREPLQATKGDRDGRQLIPGWVGQPVV